MKLIRTICRSNKSANHRDMSTYTSHRRSSLACLVGLIIVATTGMQAWGLNPALPPGDNFDLSHWYLGLPVDDSGGTSGDSASISVASLVAGYEHPDYFYTDTDGSMTFWAPVNGATTSGSSYPRSELRENIVPGDNNSNWSGYGLHILEAQCKVTQLPSSEKVIIGQIHSKTGLARPLVKLYYDGSKNPNRIRVLIKQDADDPDNSSDDSYNLPNVPLGDMVNYRIQMEDGFITVTVNGSTITHDAFAPGTGWTDEEFYFKAGSYCQDNTGTSSEGSRVAFYSLTASHPVAGQSDLTVASAYGTPTPFVGTTSYDDGTLINAWISGSPVYDSGTVRHVSTGWTGTGDVGSGSATSTSFTLTQNSTITWQWQTQYWLFTGVSGNGSVDVVDSWLDSGTNVTITATPDSGYQFVNWSGDSSSTNPVLNLTMDAAKSVTAIFTGPVSLNVVSAYGTPSPAAGSASYPYGTLINASMSGSPDVSGTTRHLVTGWTGTGDVVAGSGASTSFTLTQASTLTWQWQTQYWLDTEVSGNGSVDVADAWFDSGAGVTITATPAAGHYFVSWSGDSSSVDPVLNLTMGAAKSVTANFAAGSAPTPVKLTVSAVSASSHDGNIPENTLDGNLGTRWSAQGDGQWIAYDLGVTQTIHELKIAWYKGIDRTSDYDVQVSLDGTSWTTVLASQTSSGGTNALEDVDIPNTSGRYVRYVGHGNSANDWNSLTEVEIWGVLPAELPTDVYLPSPEFVGGGVQFTVPSSVSGLSYQLEYTDTLNPPSWDDMGSAVIGNGGDLILTDPGPVTSNRFYRLFIQQ